MALGPFVLPFRGDQYSFGINFKSSPEEKLNFDLSCVAFDVKGQLHDTLHARKPTALDGALVKGFEKQALPEETVQVEGDDVIYMFPKKFERQVEVLLFVASAPSIPGKKHDLDSSSKLEFAVSYSDVGGQAFNQSFDLKPLAAQGGVSSIIVAVMYLQAEGGWTLRSVGDCHPFDSPGLIVPELKQTILNLRDHHGVQLDAADAIQAIDPAERVPVTRQFQDQSLDEASAGRAAEPAPVKKLRIDLSWTFWPPPPPTEEGEEPPEEPALEYNLVMYNKDGEEVQSISTGNREATGARAGRPEPEEDEEEEKEEEKEEPEEGEEGEEGEGGEPKEPPPPPPAPKVDPYEFKERDVIYLDVPDLPAEVRSMVLLVTNYDEENGFTRVRTVRCRLVDVSNGEAPLPGSKAAVAAAAAAAEQGLAAPPNPERVLADYGVLSKYEDDKATTQVALMKLYKEYADSAFNVFRGAGVDNVAAFIGQEPDTIINQLKAYLEATKKQKAAEAAAAAAAEESGEEITADPKPHVWRFRALGLNFGGDSLEAIEHDLKNLFAFDGDLAPGAARDSDTSRSSFPNGDTYFGSYADDVKHGPGLYAFATGAGYAGEYAGGKRHGRGVMVFPDGGTYVGEFVADKFEGQGQYRYPDGSVYTGSWAAGQKHGPGVYWDTARGCLRGEWKKGLLVGKGTYEQPALRFEGEFVRGMPAGTATYTLTGHRTLDMPCFAAQHIQAEEGPTLALPCAYGIPPGSGDEPQLDEEGQPIEDTDKPPLPAHPKYEGLTFTAEQLPGAAPDTVFPPEEGKPVPITAVPAFSVSTGLVA
ncbi:hypothetical protein CHLRE_03g201900v5 [Chlamydomonas reinhardtii]|uniref:Flagellar radial spoke protein 1 n=2 Tax=Chlamydomonas reinhardtii TaxID=3055 RepID=RSP1_CHLRE|nr:uncharacterized protein CHLRE_03g201900v5 [Chlamydomonas reinhardtii]Q27YU0.1 RecName: Full=Flagellar radial spoke protein 1 [Chlamydomonas reinhardtii]7JRJ_F Chain F, Flagellar radial spoke protein 1 [Chlamydomonas reinhardtii]7JTK_A Chain A, Flagellar radial spoke protein 1 [Chlamydomonas reinhardtii]7JTK_B Chain B, Flagellar radial spoke protein 1 [Chlamydomonas reinhardtii]8GLV_HX Chain HX, Flagellar radial spoke protein 1 [Chlamydomonas reinhardtii]8GLV_Hh Chain Hh, Flagellar radial s|eukprot:XP_001693353.1 radial spoke protein 1 [Chlamydomonas reinhardtii]